MEKREDPFKLKHTALTKDAAALAEYQATWSNGNHNFARSYIGAAPYKKMEQEEWERTTVSSLLEQKWGSPTII